jgi:hypothetical protein
VRTLGRIIWVPLAFLVSAAVAGFVLVTLGLERVTQTLRGSGPAEDTIGSMIDLVGHGVLIASAFTVVPALLVVIVGEVARIRSSMYYVAGGGLAFAVVPLLARLGDGGGLAMPAVPVWQVFATAGFAGGLVYWLLAGRSA